MSDATQPVAVVVPTLNEGARIGGLLRHLSTLGFAEIVVADGGSHDGTVQIAAEMAGVRLVHSPVGRGLQINAGVRATTAPALLVLHADTLLPVNALAMVQSALAEAAVAGFRSC